jgi:carbonic anhydrase
MGRPAHATVLSNFGNIIPPAGEGEDGASIECLVELGVEHIVICGHERCAALQALLGQQAMAPELRRWLMLADRTRHLIETHYCHLDEDARRSAAAQEHVLVQVENLLGYPIVRERVQSGRLYIHAWVEDRHRRLWEYRPQDGQFCATPLEVSP